MVSAFYNKLDQYLDQYLDPTPNAKSLILAILVVSPLDSRTTMEHHNHQGHHQQLPNNLTHAQYQELALGSAIDPDLIALNFSGLSGDEALSHILISDKIPRLNSGRVTSRVLRTYRHLEAGGIWISSLDPHHQWEPMEWGRFKPNQPRLDIAKGKPIKYESPPKVPNRVTYLDIPDSIWKKIAQNYQIKRYLSTLALRLRDRVNPVQFWEWVQQHPEIPIILTEGEKKAACLLSLGFVAIALPGIWNGRVGKKDFDERLHPDLLPMAQKGRKFIILFDFETKFKTRKNVYQATIRTGKAIEAQGCTCEVACLPGPQKGVDDFVVAHQASVTSHQSPVTSYPSGSQSLMGETPKTALSHQLPVKKKQGGREKGAGELQLPATTQRAGVRRQKAGKNPQSFIHNPVALLLTAILADALSLEDYQKLRYPRYRGLSRKYPPSVLVNVPYLSQAIKLPESGLVVLWSDMGTGKTELLRRWREEHPGVRFLNNGHRVNLLKNLAKRLETEIYSALRHGELAKAGALSITVDSLYKLETQANQYGCVFIDEAVQYLAHLLHSKTCKEHRAEILEVLEYIISNAQLVVLADAHMDDTTVDFFRAMRPELEKPLIVKNEFKNGGRKVFWYEGGDNSALVAQIFASLMAGKKVMVASDSKRFIKKLETAIMATGNQSSVTSHPSGSQSLMGETPKTALSHQLPVTEEAGGHKAGEESPVHNQAHSAQDKRRKQDQFANIPNKIELIEDNSSSPEQSLESESTALISNSSNHKDNTLDSSPESKNSPTPQFPKSMRVWSIHSENSGSEENVAFIKDITTQVKNIDALLASPSLGTGVDIPDYHFDLVFGVFCGVSQTATECAQSLHRYRPKVPMHIWVAPRPPFGYQQTNARKIKQRMLENNEITAFLLRIDRETGKRGCEKDWALDAYCQIEAARHQSINNLRSDLRSLLEEMGNEIILMGDDKDELAVGALKDAGQTLDEIYCRAVSAANKITATDYHNRQSKDYLTPEEVHECEKYRIWDAYGIEVTPELVEKDDTGRLIRGLVQLEAILAPPEGTIVDERTGREYPAPPQIVAERDRSERDFLPLCMDWGNYTARWLARFNLGLHSVLKRLVAGEEVTATDLDLVRMSKIATMCGAHIKAILGFRVPANCKPMWLLGILANQLGLKLTCRKQGKRGEQVRVYSLSCEELEFAISVLEHREYKRQRKAQRLREFHEQQTNHQLRMHLMYGFDLPSSAVSIPRPKRVVPNFWGGVDTEINSPGVDENQGYGEGLENKEGLIRSFAELLLGVIEDGRKAVEEILSRWSVQCRREVWYCLQGMAAEKAQELLDMFPEVAWWSNVT